MGTIEYTSIQTIKKSEKATIEVAFVDGFEETVIVKRLKGVNPDIFHQISKVHSVYIPKIYRCEIHGEELFVLEEHLAGENLEEYLRANRLNDKQKLDIALQLCEAVKCLHDQTPPIIHRDIKPSNILISEKGALKLIDFDASRYYREDDDRSDTRLLGTVEFAPPEQFGYSQTDVRSDIYSMGMVFRELELTERRAFARAWEKIIGKCRNFDPKDRYQKVEELEKDIRRILVLSSVTEKSVLGWAMAVLMFVIVMWQGCLLHQTREMMEKITNREATGTPVPTGTAVTPTEPSDLTEPPVSTEPPAPTKPPVSAESPAPTEPPVSAESPAPTESPMSTEPPVPTKPLESAEDAADNAIAAEAEEDQKLLVTTKEIDEFLASTNQIAYGYYKDMADQTEFYLLSNFLLKEGVVCEGAVFHEVVTGERIEVPEEMLHIEGTTVHISDEFLLGLKETYYEVVVSFWYRGSGDYSTRDVIRVYADSAGKRENRVLCDYYEFFREFPWDIPVMIDWFSPRKIEGLYVSKLGSLGNGYYEIGEEMLTAAEESGYEISRDQKVLTLKKEFLTQYMDRDMMLFYILCDDGQYYEARVYFIAGKPIWVDE